MLEVRVKSIDLVHVFCGHPFASRQFLEGCQHGNNTGDTGIYHGGITALAALLYGVHNSKSNTKVNSF